MAMSTPYMAFVGWAKGVITAFWVIWITTMVVSRLYIFHEAYILETQKLLDERYLLEKCQDSEFYSNIRQHTSICTEVAANARSNVILKSLNVMAQNTYVCGGRPCGEVIRTVVARMSWQALGVLCIAMILFPNLIHSLSRSLGSRYFIGSERGLIERHQRHGISSIGKTYFFCKTGGSVYPGQDDEMDDADQNSAAAVSDAPFVKPVCFPDDTSAVTPFGALRRRWNRPIHEITSNTRVV